jgi:hypothetical protein
MELDKRLFAVDGNGTGVALGDLDMGRVRPLGPGRMVVLALAPLTSLARDALDRPRGLVADLPAIEERVVDREIRVDVSDGVLVPFGGMVFNRPSTANSSSPCQVQRWNAKAQINEKKRASKPSVDVVCSGPEFCLSFGQIAGCR